MTEYAPISIGFIALAIGFLIGRYIQQLKQKTLIEQNQLLNKQFESYKQESKQNTELKYRDEQKYRQNLELRLTHSHNEKETIREQKELLANKLVQRNTEFDNLQERTAKQKEELEQLQQKFSTEFENLATKILEEKSEKFTHQNKENIKNILQPLEEKIKTFEKKVDDTQKESISMHSALREQLLGLKDLNLKMSEEANNLTKALKGDNKIQGNWGELVLERVLEKSGLDKDREYFVQQNFTREDGSRVLPDVVIHLPNNKKMIIDSKVSLVDYERFINTDSEEQQQHLKAHVNSIKKHVEQLSAKNYQDLYAIASPDFVLMFIPIDPAFAFALNEDNTLYNKAFEKNIVIVTPTTLLATLRTIDTMWNNEKQQQNAIEIARQAGALYDKFKGLVTDLTGVGKKIDDAKKEYSAAMNKLVEGRGNLITSVEKLKKMGAKAKKTLPEAFLKRANENDNAAINN